LGDFFQFSVTVVLLGALFGRRNPSNVLTNTGMSDELKTKDKDNKKRKDALFHKMAKAFDDYIDGIILVVNVNSAGSFQLQKLRAALRDQAVLVMGKNTMIRKVLRERYFTCPDYLGLLPYLTGTIGLLFTRGNVANIAKLISKHTFVSMPAKEGMVATSEIYIPAGYTSTLFFFFLLLSSSFFFPRTLSSLLSSLLSLFFLFSLTLLTLSPFFFVSFFSIF